MNAALLLTLVASSCAPQAVDTTLIVAEDPELGALASSVISEVSERSGMSLNRPVRVARRSRAALESYLNAKLEKDLPEEKADQITAVYSLLGQAPADLDLRSLLASVYGEQVVGFYEPDSTALFVVDDQPPETLEPILVHELVHAIQDQNESLNGLTDEGRGNDAQVAAQAAIEGHATLVMMEWMFSKMGGQEVAFEDLPDFGGMVAPLLETVRTQYPALAQAPRVVQEGLLYPYLEGAGYVLEVWKSDEGRPSPIGEYLPGSTEQVSDPLKRLGTPVDAPVRIEFQGSDVVYQNNLGWAEFRIVLEEWGGTSEDRDFADGWAGDQFALYGTKGEWSLRWVTLWDDLAARDRLAAALSQMSGLPSGAVVKVGTYEDAPALELLLGAPPIDALQTLPPV
ncbi:MAG: hypothetical protein ACR2QM_11155 [Longimicrobiales bacterium]